MDNKKAISSEFLVSKGFERVNFFAYKDDLPLGHFEMWEKAEGNNVARLELDSTFPPGIWTLYRGNKHDSKLKMQGVLFSETELEDYLSKPPKNIFYQNVSLVFMLFNEQIEGILDGSYKSWSFTSNSPAFKKIIPNGILMKYSAFIPPIPHEVYDLIDKICEEAEKQGYQLDDNVL